MNNIYAWIDTYDSGNVGKVTFEKNTIENSQIGVHIEDIYFLSALPSWVAPSTDMTWRRNELSSINFIDVDMAVRLVDVNRSLVIPISDSYWGTTDLEAIGNLITDNADDYTLGTVSVVNPVSSLIDISAD